MTRSTALRTLLAFLAGVAFVGAVVLVDQSFQDRASDVPQAARGGPPAAERDEDENEEKEEQAEKLERRLEALEAAERSGEVGQSRPAAAAASPGWAGETPFDPTADDWEPAIAADPSAPWVYALVTRYGGGKPCPGNCPTPYTALRDQQRRRRDVGTVEAAVRLQGGRPVRPDHRGRPADRQRLRAVHERLQRGLREVDRPRRDMVRTGQDVRQRELERQAGHRGER